MTEENASDSSPVSDAGGTGSAPSQPPARSSPIAMVVGIAALVLAVAAAALAGYLWYQVQVAQKLSRNRTLTDMKSSVDATRLEVQSIQKNFDALRGQQKDLANRVETQVDARINALQSGQKTLGDHENALSKSIEKIYQDLDRNRDSWALEEVEQLMRIANNSLRLSGDVATSTTALQLADQRLEALGNPAFLDVRKLLARDIASLKSLQPVDIAGISLKLGGLAAKVSDLPLAEKAERPVGGGSGAPGGTGEKSPGRASAWAKAGEQLLHDLKQLVRIQNVEKPPKPLLTPNQRYFLFANLRLMLSGAQIAALTKDNATFHENLDRAGKWLREYFDTSRDNVQQVLGEIDKMSSVDLNPKLPDVSDSLEKLKEIRKRMALQ